MVLFTKFTLDVIQVLPPKTTFPSKETIAKVPTNKTQVGRPLPFFFLPAGSVGFGSAGIGSGGFCSLIVFFSRALGTVYKTQALLLGHLELVGFV